MKMDEEIRELNRLVTMMPYYVDTSTINDYADVGCSNGAPSLTLKDVKRISNLNDYFAELNHKFSSGELLSKNCEKCVGKKDKFDTDFFLAKYELKKLDRKIVKKRQELKQINEQIKAAKLDRISLLGRITLYQQQLILMAQAKDALEAMKKEEMNQIRTIGSGEVELSDYIA